VLAAQRVTMNLTVPGGEADLRAEPPAKGARKCRDDENRKRFGAKRQN